MSNMSKRKARNILFSVKVIILLTAIAGQSKQSSPPSTVTEKAVTATCSLSVHVNGFRNQKGIIGCAVFNSSNGWPENDGKAYTRAALPIKGKRATINFPHVPPGRYAIAVLHDENANHRLDRNIFRIPKEGFGFANNSKIGLSAPSWADASVQVSCPNTQVDIHLVYK